jgi:predicted esterase
LTFHDVRSIVFENHAKGDYQASLDAIDAYRGESDDEQFDLSFWRACLLSRLGRIDEAWAEFSQRLAVGSWWGEGMLQDPDLENMRSHPEWQRLVNASMERARGEVNVPRSPIDKSPRGDVRATLVAFHGGAERPEMMVDRCAFALHWGIRIVALHGTAPAASERFGWPLTNSEQVVTRQLEEVGDLAEPIMIGFSQGGGLAGYLAWSHHVASAGVILVAPAMGIRGVPIPNTKVAPVKTYLLVGSDDWALEDTRHAAEALSRSGVPVRLDERQGTGHDWPEDFDKILQDGLEWILNG